MASTSQPQYKDVVVVGNGPSAITLSYMLAGNWPYYQGEQEHPIEFLHAKLSADKGLSLVEQDLEVISEGLEGRSQNPVSVLLDTLTHYEADLGVDSPSFLEWRYNSAVAIDHVVIGNGMPGGTWQLMEGSMLTISPGNWMELPNMNFREWNSCRDVAGMKQSRAVVGSVASYYKDYVYQKGLDPFFRSNCIVRFIKKIFSHTGKEMWQVDGLDRSSSSNFVYITPAIVLATGAHNKPNLLEIPGEKLPFVVHSLPQLEKQMEAGVVDKVLIVGAGLSAADAIITAGFYKVPVAHVFRRNVSDPKLIFNQLPGNMYPEYHKVHRMMKTCGSGYHQSYKSFSQQQIREICPNGTVLLTCADNPIGEIVSIVKVSHVCLLIGSKPDLSFFANNGSDLGLEKGQPIDSKANPVDINVYTHEIYDFPGLYALGPLVGDNFVRFLQGGALAITNRLQYLRNANVHCEV